MRRGSPELRSPGTSQEMPRTESSGDEQFTRRAVGGYSPAQSLQLLGGWPPRTKSAGYLFQSRVSLDRRASATVIILARATLLCRRPDGFSTCLLPAILVSSSRRPAPGPTRSGPRGALTDNRSPPGTKGRNHGSVSNRPRARERLEPLHHPRRSFHHIRLRPRRFFQRGPAYTRMVHGLEDLPQQFRRRVRVERVGLVAPRPLAAPIADDHPLDERREQIVQPLRLRDFLNFEATEPRIPPKNSRMAAAVARMLPAITRPPSSRTEMTLLLDGRRGRHTWFSVS